MQTTLIRLKPYDVRRGHLLKRYTYAGIRFAAGEWCCVDTAVADYLRTVHQTDRYSPLAFELGDEEPAPAPASAPPPTPAVERAASADAVDVEALIAELTLLVVEPPTSPAIELTAGVDAADVEALVTELTLLVVEPPTHSAESAAAMSIAVEPSTAVAEPVTPVADLPAASVESVAPIVEPVLIADETSTKSPAEAVEGMLPAAVADAPALVCATKPAPTVSAVADDTGDLVKPGAPAPSRGHASQRRNGLQERVRGAQRRRDEARPDPADRRPSRDRPAPMLPPPSRRQRGPPGCSP